MQSVYSNVFEVAQKSRTDLQSQPPGQPGTASTAPAAPGTPGSASSLCSHKGTARPWHLDPRQGSGKSVPRKAAGTAEGVAGTVGSVKASSDHGDVSERVDRPRRGALAEGTGLNQGCISCGRFISPSYPVRIKASGIECIHFPLANGTSDGLKTNMYLLCAFLST